MCMSEPSSLFWGENHKSLGLREQPSLKLLNISDEAVQRLYQTHRSQKGRNQSNMCAFPPRKVLVPHSQGGPQRRTTSLVHSGKKIPSFQPRSWTKAKGKTLLCNHLLLSVRNGQSWYDHTAVHCALTLRGSCLDLSLKSHGQWSVISTDLVRSDQQVPDGLLTATREQFHSQQCHPHDRPLTPCLPEIAGSRQT